MKQFRQKAFSAFMAAALAVSCAAPASAASEPVKKEETIYLILNGDGSVREQIVSDWLHSDTGFHSFRDKSGLQDVENLKSDVLPEQDAGMLIWNTEDKDIYYQGKSELQPPVSVAITYLLDGKEIDAIDLNGKSGHLSVHVALKNNESRQIAIAGEQRTVFTPFFTVAAAMLPADSYTNITAEHGTVQTDSKTNLVCFLAMPGVSESLSGLLPENFTGLDSLMLDEITLEADVTDCRVPSFLFASSPTLEGLSLDGEGSSSELQDLQNATRELQDGAGVLDDAAATLQEKLGEFADGYSEFDAGVDSALDGSRLLAAGSENLLDNVALLSDKSAELANGASQLRDGTAQLAGLLNTQLVPGLIQAGTQKDDLRSKMEELFQQVDSVTIPDTSGIRNQLAGGVQQVFDTAAYGASSATAQNVSSGIREGCKEAAAGAISAVLNSASQASAEDAAAQYNDALSGILQSQVEAGALSEDAMNAILAEMSGVSVSPPADQSGLAGQCIAAVNASIDQNVGVDPDAVAQQITAGMSGVREQAVSQVVSAVPDLDASQFYTLLDEFQDLSGEASAMLDSVDVLTGALYNTQNPEDSATVVGAADALAAGADSLSQGASALSNGTNTFASGAGELQSGADSLWAGLQTLSSSSKTVSSSIAQFQDGGAELKDGTSQLREGLNAYASEGIEKLTGLADPDSALGQTLSAMKEQAGEYEGAGRSDGETFTVKLVMRTAAAESNEAEPAPTDTEEEIHKPQKSDTNLWERIKNLFS